MSPLNIMQRHVMINKIIGMIALASTVLFPTLSHANSINDDLKENYQNYTKNKDSLVRIVTMDKLNHLESGHGTGFLFSEDGLILTDYHVIDSFVNNPEKNLLAVHYHGERLAGYAKVLKVNLSEDLAIIKIDSLPGNLPHLNLSRQPIGEGNIVFGLGFLDSQGASISTGVSGEKYMSDPFSRKQKFNGNLDHGMSGGPIIDESGAVVGIIDLAMNEVNDLFTPADILYDFAESCLIKECSPLLPGDIERSIYAEIVDRSGRIRDYIANNIKAINTEDGTIILPSLNSDNGCYSSSVGNEKLSYSICSSSSLHLSKNVNAGKYQFVNIAAKDSSPYFKGLTDIPYLYSILGETYPFMDIKTYADTDSLIAGEKECFSSSVIKKKGSYLFDICTISAEHKASGKNLISLELSLKPKLFNTESSYSSYVYLQLLDPYSAKDIVKTILNEYTNSEVESL